MRTISNIGIDLFNVVPDNIDIHDIAHALYQINRFNGHARKPYNVLAHSICASILLPSGKKMEGLLHDASEAYIGDITTPVKEMFPEIIKYEDKLLGIIFNKYDIHKEANVVNGIYKKSPAMLTVDKRLCSGEHFVLRPKCVGTYDCRVSDLMEVHWDATPRDFIDRYKGLL